MRVKQLLEFVYIEHHVTASSSHILNNGPKQESLAQ